MRTRILILVSASVAVAFASSPAPAEWVSERNPERSLRIVTSRLAGFTKYYIRFNVDQGGTPVVGESELEFPLDTFMGGIDLKWFWRTEGGTPWSVRLGLQRSFVEPGLPMKDTDWITYERLYSDDERKKWSYTESDAELTGWHAESELRLGLYGSSGFTLDGLLGLTYQRLSFDIFGFEGWQTVGDSIVYGSGYLGQKVLEYRVSHLIPYVGVGWKYSGGAPISLVFDIAASPRARSSDRDDHVLRTKLSEGSCLGPAYMAKVEVKLEPSSPERGTKWFAQVQGD